MKQMSFGDAGYAAKKKRTRRESFLAEMEQVVPWHALLQEIEPVYPVAGRGRRPCSASIFPRPARTRT